MNVQFRITRLLLDRLYEDLSRPHQFAFERVVFLSCKPAALPANGLLLVAYDLHVIEDADYEYDDSVGAMLGAGAFRKILQHAFHHRVAMFHLHRHEHIGSPWFSDIDLRESTRFVPDFWKVRPDYPHGAIVLSHDSLAGLVWLPTTRQPVKITRVSVIGVPCKEIVHASR